MTTLLWLLGISAAVAGLALGHVAFWTWRYRRPRAPDEVHFIRTEDGWTLAISRLRGDPAGPAGGAPVICCHGFACSARTFDFERGRSLGRHLAGRGFDVWLLDLRGAGLSERPRHLRDWRHGFESYLRYDAPAAIRYVSAQHPGERVLWVGHSMGGLLGITSAAEGPERDRLGAVVMLGSPLHFSTGAKGFHGLLTCLDLLPAWPLARLGWLARAFAPLAGRLRSLLGPGLEGIFLSPANTPGLLVRRFMVEVIQDVPRQLINQFIDAMRKGVALDGRPLEAWHRALAGIEVPVLALAGSVDRLAPPRSARVPELAQGARVHQVEVVGRAHGAPADFGHLDLLIGSAAADHVYPRVSDWLLARASASTQGS